MDEGTRFINNIHQQPNNQEKTAVKPQAKRKVFQAIRPGKWAIPKRNSHNHPFCRCELVVSGRVFDPFSDLSLKFQGVSDPENEHVFQPNKVGLTVQHKICDSEILEILLSLKHNNKISTKSLNHPGPQVPTNCPPLGCPVVGSGWINGDRINGLVISPTYRCEIYWGNNPTYLYTNLWSIHPHFCPRDIHPSIRRSPLQPTTRWGSLTITPGLGRPFQPFGRFAHSPRPLTATLAAILTKQNCFGGLNQPTPFWRKYR